MRTVEISEDDPTIMLQLVRVSLFIIQNILWIIQYLMVRISSLSPLVSMAALAACSVNDRAPMDDDEKLIQATIAMLDGKDEPVCIDEKTVGRPLSVFHTITSNLPPGARAPGWFLPARFSPPDPLSNDEVYRGAQIEGSVLIDQPTNNVEPVSRAEQAKLHRAATLLSREPADHTILISESWQPGIKVRWWLRNRLSSRCTPNYHISNAINARDIGFVSVTADHWGTTYAFRRTDKGWVVAAQWSNWLY